LSRQQIKKLLDDKKLSPQMERQPILLDFIASHLQFNRNSP